MSKFSESEIARMFRERVDRGDITEDMKITCQISGGMPSERVEEEFRLAGNGSAHVMKRDTLRPALDQEVSATLDRGETRDLYKQIAPGLDSLIPRSEARFLPDSLVGSITIQVGEEETTLFFLADEEERAAQGKPIAPQMADAIQRFAEVSKRLPRRTREDQK